MIHPTLDQALQFADTNGGAWLVYRIHDLKAAAPVGYLLSPSRYENVLPCHYASDQVTVTRCGVVGVSKWRTADSFVESIVFDEFRDTVKRLGVHPVC